MIHSTSSIDINGGDYDGRAVLHMVAAAEHEQALVLLISKGANVNIIDNWDVMPLGNVVRTRKDHCIRIVKENDGKNGKGSKLLDDRRSKTAYKSRNSDVDFSELDVVDKIGGGAFGVIYKCR